MPEHRRRKLSGRQRRLAQRPGLAEGGPGFRTGATDGLRILVHRLQWHARSLPKTPSKLRWRAGRTAQPEATVPESKLRARNGECRQLIMQVRVQQGCQTRNNGSVMSGSKPCCGRGGQHADGILRPRRRTVEEKQPGRLSVRQARKSLQQSLTAVSEEGQMVLNKGWSPERHSQNEETLLSFGRPCIASPHSA